MKKNIGVLLLSFWIPFILAMAFQDVNGESPFYMIAGFMMIVFGTWGGILLIQDKN